jgi:hypothetical protein
MTSSSSDEDHTQHAPHASGGRWSRPIGWTAAMAALVSLALLAVGCGGSNGPGVAGSGSSNHAQASTTSSGTAMARLLGYARCMRSHGVSDFPDPTASPGGGAAFQINGGPGSDLDRNKPTFRAANQACQSLLPGGGQQAQTSSPQKLAAEVKWARCIRSHGLPSFPDPDSQGSFDSGKFDPGSPVFQTASNDCLSLQPAGPTAVVPGRG